MRVGVATSFRSGATRRDATRRGVLQKRVHEPRIMVCTTSVMSKAWRLRYLCGNHAPDVLRRAGAKILSLNAEEKRDGTRAGALTPERRARAIGAGRAMSGALADPSQAQAGPPVAYMSTSSGRWWSATPSRSQRAIPSRWSHV